MLLVKKKIERIKKLITRFNDLNPGLEKSLQYERKISSYIFRNLVVASLKKYIIIQIWKY